MVRIMDLDIRYGLIVDKLINKPVSPDLLIYKGKHHIFIFLCHLISVFILKIRKALPDAL